MNVHPLDIFIILTYIMVLFLIGFFTSKKIHNYLDFLVAGRRLTAPILVGSLVASYYSLDVIFGSPETAYLDGISTFYMYSAPFYVVYLLFALFVVPRVRRIEEVNSITDLMEHFYGSKVRYPSAIVIALYSLPILSITGLGILGAFYFNLTPLTATIIGASIAATYTLMGGLLADAISDVFQFILMCLTVGLAVGMAIYEYGFYGSFAHEIDPHLTSIMGNLSLGDIIVYGSIALTPFVDPSFYQRVFAARSVRDMRIGLGISTLTWALFDWFVVYLGVLGHYLVQKSEISPLVDISTIMLHIVGLLLPVGLVGLFIAGCVSAAMSTIDSYALISSSSIVYDIIKKKYPLLKDKTLLLLTRFGIIVAVGVATFFSFRFDRIREAWIVMSSILASTLVIPMLFGLFFRKQAPLSGILATWLGLGASLILFLAFEIFGVYDAAQGTRLLKLPLINIILIREHILLLSVPVSAVGYILGWYVTSRKPT